MLRTTPTVLNIQAVLRERIITGQYSPDQPLSQLLVAEDLGVSRTPVREAFRLLEQEGLVVAEHNKRFKVASFSPSDLEDLYMLRIAVESAALRVSVPQIGESDIDQLSELLASMNAAIAAESYDSWREPHDKFHATLLTHAGARTRACARDLATHAERYRYSVTLPASPMSWMQSQQDHYDLFESAVNRDGASASRQIAWHYGRVALSNLSLSAPLHDPRKLRVTIDALGSSAPPPNA